MIQLNLLPEIKREYISARRQKRFIATISSLVIAVSLASMIVLFTYNRLYRLHINGLTEDISKEADEIRSIDDIDKILTIQNQLNSVQQLHETKPESSRLFSYLTQVTPSDVAITDLSLNYVDSTLVIDGVSSNFVEINRYVDALKFAKYTILLKDAEPTPDAPAFTEVTTDLNRDSVEATFKIRMKFDPVIFDNTKDVALKVPETITTRSILNAPKLNEQQLFEQGGSR